MTELCPIWTHLNEKEEECINCDWCKEPHIVEYCECNENIKHSIKEWVETTPKWDPTSGEPKLLERKEDEFIIIYDDDLLIQVGYGLNENELDILGGLLLQEFDEINFIKDRRKK